MKRSIFIDAKRNVGIFFKVTQAEKELLERKREDAGIRNMSAYLRKMCLDGYIIHLQLKELKWISSHLAHIGNNINQIAAKVNSGGSLAEGEFTECKAEFEEMRAAYGKMVGILGTL